MFPFPNISGFWDWFRENQRRSKAQLRSYDDLNKKRRDSYRQKKLIPVYNHRRAPDRYMVRRMMNPSPRDRRPETFT